MRRKLAAGNWKMNGSLEALSQLDQIAQETASLDVETLICPPYLYISEALTRVSGHQLNIGVQDCHFETSGAHTGDISASMIADLGASHVILGHSERRADHDESSEDVREKARTALAAGLTAIICVGESEKQRLAKNTLDIIGGQLAISMPDASKAANMVIAYEPVWAIGTGRTATTAEIDEVHDFIRTRLKDRFGEEGANMTVLYGGSVKPTNAAEIFATNNVDGALVGGASLRAQNFVPIVRALAEA
ncbi:MAG: triose-phosphate isomerase [Pseudomonadota bacterium]